MTCSLENRVNLGPEVHRPCRTLPLRPAGENQEHAKDNNPDYARDLNSSEIWAQKKGRSSLI